MNAVAHLDRPDQLTLEGMDTLPRHLAHRGAAVRDYHDRSARTDHTTSADTEQELWTGEEITTGAPAERRCAQRAWPVHRVLHLVGQNRLVLSANVYTGDADLDDEWCDVREPHRKGEATAWIGRAEEKALRDLAATGLVRLGPLRKYQSRGRWFKARGFELTPAGHAWWTRWAYLVDAKLGEQDRIAAAMEAWKREQRKRTCPPTTRRRVVLLEITVCTARPSNARGAKTFHGQ